MPETKGVHLNSCQHSQKCVLVIPGTLALISVQVKQNQTGFTKEPAGVGDCFLIDNYINQLLNNKEKIKGWNLILIVLVALA